MISILGLCAAAACTKAPEYVEWTPDSHPEILEVCGGPTVFETACGPAWHFDGEDDAFFFDSVPVAGLEEFTLEVVFRQDPTASFEQRFLHMGTMGNRVLFETRVNPDSTWYFDAFVRLGESKAESSVLIDPEKTHPAGEWYSLALAASPEGLSSYVDGQLQFSSDLAYRPLITEGSTSLGVRQNRVCWFKGDILKIRTTPRALKPEELLDDYVELNR